MGCGRGKLGGFSWSRSSLFEVGARLVLLFLWSRGVGLIDEGGGWWGGGLMGPLLMEWVGSCSGICGVDLKVL